MVAEIENLHENQLQYLRVRIKYPDQNVHFIVPRLRDLKRMMMANGEEGILFEPKVLFLLSNLSHLLLIFRQ